MVVYNMRMETKILLTPKVFISSLRRDSLVREWFLVLLVSGNLEHLLTQSKFKHAKTLFYVGLFLRVIAVLFFWSLFWDSTGFLLLIWSLYAIVTWIVVKAADRAGLAVFDGLKANLVTDETISLYHLSEHLIKDGQMSVPDYLAFHDSLLQTMAALNILVLLFMSVMRFWNGAIFMVATFFSAKLICSLVLVWKNRSIVTRHNKNPRNK